VGDVRFVTTRSPRGMLRRKWVFSKARRSPKSLTIELFIMPIMQQGLAAPDGISLVETEGDPIISEIQRSEVAHLPGTAAQLIGERMRAMYAKLVREPVPGQLLELIRQLENKERSE
jgi:hypothetical protein